MNGSQAAHSKNPLNSESWMNSPKHATKLANLAEQYLKTETDNSGVIMTKTGARGSMLNIAQMVATVGQQSIRGQRIDGATETEHSHSSKGATSGPKPEGSFTPPTKKA